LLAAERQHRWQQNSSIARSRIATSLAALLAAVLVVVERQHCWQHRSQQNSSIARSKIATLLAALLIAALFAALLAAVE
jgi:sensor domain CHASE-containing protein